MAESAETESPKPKASAHFNIAENLEYEYEAETLNQGNGSPADRRRPSSHAMRSSMRSSFLTTNFDISYHPDKLTLFSKPRQRQRWGDDQVLPRVNYGDLFFDLFFVAAAYNTGNLLVESPSKRGLLYFLATFGAIMGLWLDKCFYDSRFVVVTDDVVHRVFEMIALLVVATAVLHIRPVDIMSNGGDHVETFVFCLAILMGNALTGCRYIEVYLFGIGQPVIKEEAKRFFKMNTIYIVMVVVATILAGIEYYGSASGRKSTNDKKHTASETEAYETSQGYDSYNRSLAGAISPYATPHNDYDLPMVIILAGYVGRWLYLVVNIIFCFPGGGKHKERVVPINVDFSIHRNGEWNMLMLGESILSLLIVDVDENDDYYATFYSALLTVILLQYLHFRSQPHHADSHALRRSKNAGVLWTLFHQIYSAALIAVGAGFTLLVLEFTYDDYPGSEGDHRRFLAGGGGLSYEPEERRQRTAHLFCISLATVWFCLDCMTLFHLGFQNSHDRCQCARSKKFNIKGIVVVLLRVGLLAFMATLSQYETNPETLAELGLVGVVLQLVLRKLGTKYLSGNHRVFANEEASGGPASDPEDLKWPNVTHAKSSPPTKAVAQ